VFLGRKDDAPVELLMAGTRRGNVARLAAGAGLRFAAVEAAPVRGRGPLALARSLRVLVAGVFQGWQLVKRSRPDVVFATGGYASVPVSLAARLQRVPLVLYLPDVYPGWAVRLLAAVATRIAVSSEGALRHLPRGRSVVTGYPTRARFWTLDRRSARAALGLPQDEKVLLVTGASQGSHAINLAVFHSLDALVSRCHVFHQTGEPDLSAALERAGRLETARRHRYTAVAYVEDMPAAMLAADLVVMRAGASALAEPPAAGLPAVLVPGTFAGGHQRYNAQYMQQRGAAVMLEEAHLGALAMTVGTLLEDGERMRTMAAAARSLARPGAATALAGLVAEAAA
jgi:UDP-N-acetylglucosamine--N-acetylmuramyl-(pentapeptide) pyrophosphoryl-undecaprenol N-acetylglucosamine transferase